MPEKIRNPSHPSGFSRLLFRAPIWLYRSGLGWLLGERFLYLIHIGRKSGIQRHTVLEVIHKEQDSLSFYVASGWGNDSDWYKNIMRSPNVEIQVGRKRWHATAEKIPIDKAEEIMLIYGENHPHALRELSRFMGYRIENTEAEYRALGRLVPILAFIVTSRKGVNSRSDTRYFA